MISGGAGPGSAFYWLYFYRTHVLYRQTFMNERANQMNEYLEDEKKAVLKEVTRVRPFSIGGLCHVKRRGELKKRRTKKKKKKKKSQRNKTGNAPFS